jgi:hypothetical protein
MSSLRNAIKKRLEPPAEEPQKQVSLSIKIADLEKLELLSTAMSKHTGGCITRNQLIYDAIDAYISEAIDCLQQEDIPMDDSLLQVNYDAVVFPAQEEGFRDVFLGEEQWYYVRISKHKIPHIKYVAIYVNAPISAITHYAEVAEDGFVLDVEEGKYIVKLASSPKKLTRPIPRGLISPASVRSPKYTTLNKLLHAEKFADL